MWLCILRQQVKNNFRVRVGDHHNVNIDAYEQEFEVDDIISHPRYSSSTFLNGGMCIIIVCIGYTAYTGRVYLHVQDLYIKS